MAIKKVTLSIDEDTFADFQKVKKHYGFSISAWVTAQMQNEVDQYTATVTMQKKYNDCMHLMVAMINMGIDINSIEKTLANLYDPELIENIFIVITNQEK